MTRTEFYEFFENVYSPEELTGKDVCDAWRMWLDALDEDGEDVSYDWELTQAEVNELLKRNKCEKLPSEHIYLNNYAWDA